MNEFEIRLHLLIDILDKKCETLNIILNLTENQGTILQSDNKTHEVLEMFREVTAEKQRLIDEILYMDTAFNKSYELIKHNFSIPTVVQSNRSNILKMQGLITDISNITTSLELSERNNDDISTKLITSSPRQQTPPHTPKFSQSQANYLLNSYSKNIIKK